MMTDESRELHIYCDNTARIVTQIAEPNYRNLERKMRRGIYDRNRALKAMRNVADYAAKEYCREFGGTWFTIFPVSARNECAAALLQSFENEIECGNGWLAR